MVKVGELMMCCFELYSGREINEVLRCITEAEGPVAFFCKVMNGNKR